MRLPKPVDGPGSDTPLPSRLTSIHRWFLAASPPGLLAGALAPVRSGPAQSERIPVEGPGPELSAMPCWLRRTVRFRRDRLPGTDSSKNTADLRRLSASVTRRLRPDAPALPPSLPENQVGQHFLVAAPPLCSGQLQR